MIGLILLILAAQFKAIADTLAHHFDTSIFRYRNARFWNPVISSDWAKKIFAYKVDAWHLCNSAMIVLMVSAIVFHQPELKWYWEILIGGTAWNLSFNLGYNKIYR